MTRFEGGSQSGKTTASKLLTTLLYGEYQQKKSTIAANYSDGAANPLVSLDNIETSHMTDDLMMFLLTAVTGVANEKRRTGTDTGTVVERTKCLLSTSGIEPLYGHLEEILTRTFVIRFNKSHRSERVFLEAEVLARIQEHRDLILSSIMKKTSMVLAMCRDGAHRDIMRLLTVAMGDHGKSRCNDYLALMYLMMLADGPKDMVKQGMSELAAGFIRQVNALNETTVEMSRESNQVATVLSVMFRSYDEALQADAEGCSAPGGKSHKMAFAERYLVRFAEDGSTLPMSSRELFTALNKVAGSFRLPFRYTTPQQLGCRLVGEVGIIREAGFEITSEVHRERRKTYTIRRVGEK